MNTEKFKSVAVPMEVYKEIKILAQHEDRPISNQLIKILREWKEDRIKEAEHLSLSGGGVGFIRPSVASHAA